VFSWVAEHPLRDGSRPHLSLPESAGHPRKPLSRDRRLPNRWLTAGWAAGHPRPAPAPAPTGRRTSVIDCSS